MVTGGGRGGGGIQIKPSRIADARPCGVCGGRSGFRQGFVRVILVSTVRITPPIMKPPTLHMTPCYAYQLLGQEH